MLFHLYQILKNDHLIFQNFLFRPNKVNFTASNENLAKKQIERSKNGYETSNGNPVHAWTKKCSEYFEKSILPDLNTLASYEIKKYVSYLFNDLTGLTTNPI